jgi:DNA-entry nuclease
VGEQRAAEKALGVPKYSGSPFYALNDNQPAFKAEDITSTSYEFYSELDSLGRCGYTMACIGRDIMPAEGEDRGSISSVRPSGWVNNKYDTELVDGGYIYNRCHLIGWQLTAENANEKNLITGTRYMNVDGMLPFENMVADYVKETGNHVMYRVTPIYDGNDLVACGVQLEAYSVEDDGEEICFNVYVYNVQPGIAIDYATGNNWLSGEQAPLPTETQKPIDTENGGKVGSYVLNKGSKKIHLPSCRYAEQISESNRDTFEGNVQDLLDDNYTACGTCKPAA